MTTFRGTPVEGATVLVTGANRGLGLAFVQQAKLMGAAKIYAGVRNPDEVPAELRAAGAHIVELDVTDPGLVDAAAGVCGDTTVVVNNAGLFTRNRLIEADDREAARAEMEVNYFGPLTMIRAFAPVLAARGGGSIVNVLSVAAIAPTAFMGGYSPAKAAALSLGGIARAELEPHGITVTSLIVGSVDTRMASHVQGHKENPLDIAATGLAAMQRGEWTCDTDFMAIDARARLARDPIRYERGLGKLLFAGELTTRS